MKIRAEVIPHDQQRYETTGDWWIEYDEINIRVSKLGTQEYEMAVMVHEIVESVLCHFKGVNPGAVDAFDMAFEDAREDYNLRQGGQFKAPCGCFANVDGSEPGDDKHAPYYKEHQLATSVERMLVAEMGQSWNDYDDTCHQVSSGG